MRWLGLMLLIGCGASGAPEADLCAEPGALCVFSGVGLNGFNGDGLPAEETMLYYPSSVFFSPDDRLTLVDFNNMRVRIEDGGALVTIAGNGEHNWSSPGSPALDSPLENPIDALFTPDGALLILPLHEQRVLTVDADGTLQVYAGTGEWGYDGDGGPASEARMSQAAGITMAHDGTLYIADTENHAVRAVDTDGLMWTAAGCGAPGFSDGPALEACLDSPQRMAWADGALYIADMGNSAVRRLTGDRLETVAGTGEAGFSGDGGPALEAQLSSPTGVDVAPDGALYIADGANHVVRRVRPDGVIETVAGTPGVAGFEALGGPPLETPLNYPGDVAVSPDGDLIIADMLNGAVQILYGPLP